MSGMQLLFFEAANCLMAIPASEVSHLEGSYPRFTEIEDGSTLDLDQYFMRQQGDGPWLHWGRGPRKTWLRVRRVVDVATVSLSGLRPMPNLLQGPHRTRAFLAVGIHGGVVYLLLDPGRLLVNPLSPEATAAVRNSAEGRNSAVGCNFSCVDDE
jgi:hypothetical protein